MTEKDSTRAARTIEVASAQRHGAPGKVAYTLLINNRSDNSAAKGCITIYDADSGDATGVVFGAVPSGKSDGRTVQIAGPPEVMVVHFESSDPEQVWNGVLNGPDIPNPVIINLT